jgi:methylthioribose-1-phosphate isomerase
MLVEGRETRSIQLSVTEGARPVPEVLDQTRLPHEVRFVRLETLADAERAIREMWVRGAPLIGAAAAYGMALAAREDPSIEGLREAAGRLADTRPTAVNLEWALRQALDSLLALGESQREEAAFALAAQVAEADVDICRRIGEHGEPLLRAISEAAGEQRPLQVLTHCNAGWLATVDWGTALSPVYRAHRSGLPLHVWVSETR